MQWQPSTDQTFYKSMTLFLPNSTFYWLMRMISIEHLRRAPQDTCSCPIWDLHMFYLLRPIFSPNLSLFFRTMLFERPSVLSRFSPVRARGVKSRMCPPYPQRDRKRRLNGAVCRNHRIKRVVPCRCLDGHVKEPYEMSMALGARP